MKKATVAIVGKPNVGKSSLFNRIVGERKSIVYDEPGVTRDRIYGTATWLTRTFNIIDTGGIEIENKPFQESIRIQAEIAIQEADVIVFVCDGRQDITEDDLLIAKILKKSNKPILLAINKIDDITLTAEAYQFYQLGIDSDLTIISCNHGIGIGDLLDRIIEHLPVISTQKEEDVIWTALLPALEMALNNFISMRSVEGEHLKQDILQKGKRIQELVEEVETYAPSVVVEYQEKLHHRIKELLAQTEIDEQRLAMEVAIIADKGCIDEELTRLHSHLQQLESILHNGGQVGRKLDFLVQEMNRESNTIASKANDIRIVQATIALKSEIEKIREQIQNLE